MNQHHRCCTFVSPGLPTIGGYPGESRGGEPMPSALYFLKSICMREIIHSPRMVMMCDEKKYNPQGGSLLACIITQGRLRCTCQPCAIESITPDGVMAHRVVWWRLVGAGVRDAFPPPMCVWIIYAFRLGGLRGKILRSVVGAVPMCPPASPCKGASTIHPRAQCVYSWYGNATAQTFGWAHRRRPYGFV